MTISVLDSDKDRASWLELLHRLPDELDDAYYQPEYLDLHRFDACTRPVLFAYASGGSLWLYPFVLRTIPPLGDSSREDTLFDIEPQYGYGGPLSNSEDPLFLREANAAFLQWCGEKRVVAEFVRFHPLIRTERFMDSVEVLYDRETVSLDLNVVNGSQLPFDAKTNNMLRRAERSGLQCHATTSQAGFAAFVQLYQATMERLGASEYYYFDARYFAGLKALIDRSGFLVVAEIDGAIVAAAVFFQGRKFLHYHLSATDPGNKSPGVMNAVLYAAALHARGGAERLHLGGGRSTAPDDSLLKFKRTMSTDRHSFQIGKRIHDPERYQVLRSAWECEYPHLVAGYGRQLLCYHNR